MDAFSYLSVLLSIIIGLAITQVLQGYRALLLHRSRIRFSAPPLIWSALILVMATQMWWSSFGLTTHHDWSFLSFSVILLQTIFLYMMSAIVLPDPPGDAVLDLSRHYEAERRPMFLFLVGALLTSVVKDIILDGHLSGAENMGFHLFFGGFALAGAFLRGKRTHLAIALIAMGAFILYIGLLFARL